MKGKQACYGIIQPVAHELTDVSFIREVMSRSELHVKRMQRGITLREMYCQVLQAHSKKMNHFLRTDFPHTYRW